MAFNTTLAINLDKRTIIFENLKTIISGVKDNSSFVNHNFMIKISITRIAWFSPTTLLLAKTALIFAFSLRKFNVSFCKRI